MNQFIDFQQQYLDQFNTYLHNQLVQRIKQPQVQAGMLYSLFITFLVALLSLSEILKTFMYFLKF